MRKEGYSETTIERYVRLLKELAKQGKVCCGHSRILARITRNHSSLTPTPFQSKWPSIRTNLGFHQMDGVGGMAVGVFIVVSYVVLRETTLVLLDAYHNPQLVEERRGIVESNGGVEVKDVLKCLRTICAIRDTHRSRERYGDGPAR